MVKKQARVSERMLLTWGMLAGLILLFTPQSLTGKFQFAYARIFHVPLGIGRGLMLSANASQPLEGEMVSRRKYHQLQNHLANVTQWLRQERQKVEMLSGLRDRSVWQGVNFVIADVIAVADGRHGKLIINRGGNDGLAEGQFVLGDYSIIGIVTRADSRTAQVTLLTDPTSKIAVKIAELDVGAIMQGCGKNLANIRMLSRRHKISIGDIVYAQKKPGLLSTAMVVGTVARCEADDENPLLWEITVKPACDTENLDNVAVVVLNPT